LTVGDRGHLMAEHRKHLSARQAAAVHASTRDRIAGQFVVVNEMQGFWVRVVLPA